MKPITQKEVQDLFYYIDGRLIWRSGKLAGKPAGTKETLGYIRIGHDYQRYYEHELAWIYCYGKKIEHPNVTDHINRDRTDNKLSNLREATRKENFFNTPAYDNVE